MSTPVGSTAAATVGASMTGLPNARVLSDHVDHVTVLEHGHLPENSSCRRGVPQGRQGHALLVASRSPASALEREDGLSAETGAPAVVAPGGRDGASAADLQIVGGPR